MKFKWAYAVQVRNCPKGSGVWYHEQRHVWQEKNFSLMSIDAFASHVLLWSGVILLFNGFFDYSKLLLGAWLFFDLALEFDADWYAVRKVGFWKYYLKGTEV